MKIPVLEGEIREKVGSRESRRLRSEGRIPCVLYGDKKGTVHLILPMKLMAESVHHGVHLVEVHAAGKKAHAIIKDVQFDHLGDRLLHVDLNRVDLEKKVIVTVPLEYVGSSIGAREGGVVEHLLNDIEVECLPQEIPGKVQVDVSPLAMGDSISLGKLTLPEGVKAIGEPNSLVVIVNYPEAEEEPAAEEAATEPEIIKSKEAKETEEDKE